MFTSLRPGSNTQEHFSEDSSSYTQQQQQQGEHPYEYSPQESIPHHRYHYEDEVLMHDHHHGAYAGSDENSYYDENNNRYSNHNYEYDEELDDEDIDGELDDIDDDMPPPLAPPKELHPGRLYALYEFNGPDPSQCDLEFDDAVILLNDEDSYWWLIKKVKDGKIGFAPAECLETPGERLARLNCWKNEELERLHKINEENDGASTTTSKATKLGKSLFGSLSRKNTRKGNSNNGHKEGKSVVFNDVLDYSETVYITDDEFDEAYEGEEGYYEEGEDPRYAQDIDEDMDDMDDDEEQQIIEEEAESDYSNDNPYNITNESHHSDSVIRYDDKDEINHHDDNEEDIVIQANNSISSTSSTATATTTYNSNNNSSSSRVQQPPFLNNNSTSTLTNSPTPPVATPASSSNTSATSSQQQQFSSPSMKNTQQRTFLPLESNNGSTMQNNHVISENSPTAARGLMNSGSMATMNSSSIGEYSPSSSSLDDDDFDDDDFSDNDESTTGSASKPRRKSKRKEERSTPTKYQVLSSLQLSAAKNNSARNNVNNSSLMNNSSLANLSAVPLQFPNGSANSSASSTNNNLQMSTNINASNVNNSNGEMNSPAPSVTSPLNIANNNGLNNTSTNNSLNVNEEELREVKNSYSLIVEDDLNENSRRDQSNHQNTSLVSGVNAGAAGYDGDDETSRISASSNINTSNHKNEEEEDYEGDLGAVPLMKNSESLADEIEKQIQEMENDNSASTNNNINREHLNVIDSTDESLLATPTKKNRNLFGNLTGNNNGTSPLAANDVTPRLAATSSGNAADLTPTRDLSLTPSGGVMNGSGGKLLLSPSKSLSKSKNRLENVQLDDFNKQLDISPSKNKGTTESTSTAAGRAHVPYFDMLRSASTEDFLQHQQDKQSQKNTSLVAGTAFSSVFSKSEKKKDENSNKAGGASVILNRSNSAAEPRNTRKLVQKQERINVDIIPDKRNPIKADAGRTTTTTIMKSTDGKNSQVVMMMKNQSMSDLLAGYHPKVEEIYSSVFNRADELSLKLEELKKMLSS